jgi:type III restriction enzyme
LPKGNKIATHLAKPYLQVNTAELTGWLDDYIRERLFGEPFDPMEADENWRLLLLQPVVDHITRVFAVALIETRSGGLEKAFIEWAQADSSVEAFCKLSETRHDFARLRYVKEDGLPAFYSPDFLVREPEAVYLVETKAQGQLSTPNVQRKLKAATAWCERVNALAPEHREQRQWHYVLLGEDAFRDWRSKGAHLAELLRYARVRPLADPGRQQSLGL